MLSPLLTELIEAFRCLPGVGPKSAQRMAFHLLERDRSRGLALAGVMQRAVQEIGRCETCRTFCEQPQCGLCDDPTRDRQTLCVVEGPADVLALEQATRFRGRYFVLLGRLSPLDGIGPEDLGFDLLQRRLKQEPIEELIIATNSTVEGEATAEFLRQIARQSDLRATRIAHGVPVGGELEYSDQGTLAHALSGRTEF